MDESDLHSTVDSAFFRCACDDVLRVISILSLDSTDVTRPRQLKPFSTNFKERIIFFSRFFYMVFIKGFTPAVFDVVPFALWRALTIAVYVYRKLVLPFWLRTTGYLKFASWENIGEKQPAKDDPVSQPLRSSPILQEGRLTKLDFGDPQFEVFVERLHEFSAHLSPHSQSPGNPFTHIGFPGNFFDHLTGVYKILLAWKQPQYLVRAGLFHSVYGTYDYRYSLYDLREGREKLSNLIGDGAEELAFAVCTSDRVGLIRTLMQAMYGEQGARDLLEGKMRAKPTSSSSPPSLPSTSSLKANGNPYPPLIGRLQESGFPVVNHITQKEHIFSADFFAQFSMVTIADFMEQGAIGFGSADIDICMFQFMRFRFFHDWLLFVKPYLRSFPPVWSERMRSNGSSDSSSSGSFIEPSREEVLALKILWSRVLAEYLSGVSSEWKSKRGIFICMASAQEKGVLADMCALYPYLAEPRLLLAAALEPGQELKELKRSCLAQEALELFEAWGQLSIRDGKHHLKEAIQLARAILQPTA